MEKILLCGSEIREKRKLLLLLWQKRPLCPWFFFLFLICNHFLTDFHVECFFISSPMLKSVNGWGFTWKIWSRVPAPGLTVLIDHIGPGAGLRPDGTVQPWVHLSRLPCTLRLGFARLAPLIFFVSMTKIKVQEEYINDNLELCPNRGYYLGNVFHHTFFKGMEGKGQITFKYSLSHTAISNSSPHCVSWTHHSCINQLVQGFEISWPNHRILEILISVYMKLWLWLQTLYLVELTSVIPYSGFEVILAIFLKSGYKLSLLVLWAKDNLLLECILLKAIFTNNFKMAIVVYVSNWTDNNYLWACDPDLKKKKKPCGASEFTFVRLYFLFSKWILVP